MDIREAMLRRHTVRKFKETPLPDDVIEKLNERIAQYNDSLGLSISLEVNDTRAFGTALRLTIAKTVHNYFILAGPDEDSTDEALGYCGADLMLYAQTLGLNTWFIAGTYNKKAVCKIVGDAKVIGVIVVGYGETQGKPHKSKTIEEVSK